MEQSTASSILPTLRRIRDQLRKEENILPNLQDFADSLANSINTRVRNLIDNKILRICTLLDPRFTYDDTFKKENWILIQEDLLQFAKQCFLFTYFLYYIYFLQLN